MAASGLFDEELELGWFDSGLDVAKWFDETMESVASGATTITVSDNTGATYSGTADTMVKSLNPTTNYGTNTVFEATNWDSTDVAHGLIKFTGLSSVGAGTVTNAKLRLYVAAFFSTPTTNVFAALRDFVENQATWNEASSGVNWGTAGANNTSSDYNSSLLSSLTVSASGAYVEFTGSALTAYVQAIISGGADYGLHLRDSSEPASPLNRGVQYTSKEGLDGRRPELVFDWVAGGGGGVTGVGSSSQAQTSAASGSHTVANVTGAATTSQAQTSVATGTHSPAAVTGTATSSQAQTSAANGAFSAGITGVGSSSQAQTSNATGSHTVASVSGAGASSQAQTSAATGSHTVASVSGSGSTSQAQSSSAIGTHAPLAVSGTVASSQAQTSAANGAFSVGISGTGASSQAQTSSGTGAHTVAGVTCSVTSSQAQTNNASGSHTVAGVSGVGSSSQAQTSTANGSHTVGVSGVGSSSQAQSTNASGAFTIQAVGGNGSSSQAQTSNGLGIGGNAVQPSGGKGFEIVGRTSLKDVIRKQRKLRGDYPADEIIATPIQAVKAINSIAKESVNQPFVANTNALETLKNQLEASSIKWRDYYAELLEAQRSQYLTEAIRQAQYSQALQESILLDMQKAEAERLQTQDEEMAILALMLEI